MVSSGPQFGMISTNACDIDAKLWIDRQGIIQSDGIKLLGDLPRFLVLLLAFQCFDLEDWCVITALNPKAELIHNPNPSAGGYGRPAQVPD